MLLERLPQDASADAVLDAFLDYVKAKKLELYPAQEQAILELLEDSNVILKTPTGSGKSLVAAALHYISLCGGRRSVYTSPIKALVNEKFLSLCKDFGPENVGMSTGDATVNQQAPILCCTAEVLANMALRQGEHADVDDVIMDEFHYYSDRERGVSWQIPLLTLFESRFLLISATLGDTRFFERELTRCNGLPTVTVASTERPVPLAFNYAEESLEDLIPQLREHGRLPVYLVHFTQRNATDTAQKLLSLDFCSKAEKDRLSETLATVRFSSPFGKEMKKYLRHGIGVHHAGLLPKYRILVEKLAQQNQLKVICGTDTLGVGVNVPIRTVLFTSLCKYDGDKTRILPVRDFHQIAGRAGRKGFDDEGFVIAQAPEHVIENRKLERKAAENPAKARKLVRRKPPTKGFVHWDEKTFQKLIDSPPEELSSSFQVSHGMLLNVLSREEDGCRAMKQIVRDCHDTPTTKREHRRRAMSLFRSLVQQQIVELLPERDQFGRKVRVNVDLQEDFSLNHALSLYLVDTVSQLDPDQPDYALVVLSLVEAVLENPDAILRKQIDRLKEEKIRELKEQGVEFEDRIEAIQDIEHPKPNRDFIYNSFNEFAAKHPWVGRENIQPKSIAREMFERYLSFADYVRSYNLHRAEGVLLRHLTGVFKTLVQTVPESFWNEDIEEIILYLEQLVRGTDSSLLDEWEIMRNPDYQPEADKELQQSTAPAHRLDPQRNRDALLRACRDAIFRFLRPLSQQNFLEAAEILAELSGRPPEDAAPPPVVTIADQVINEGRGIFKWNQQALAEAMQPYMEIHYNLRLDPAARSKANTHFFEDPIEQCWLIDQTLVDIDELNDWSMRFAVDLPRTLETGIVHLNLLNFGPN